MPVVRPRIDDLYLSRVRCAYPKETASIKTVEGIIKFALEKVLEGVGKQ